VARFGLEDSYGIPQSLFPVDEDTWGVRIVCLLLLVRSLVPGIH
jgi:hypothetical protein